VENQGVAYQNIFNPNLGPAAAWLNAVMPETISLPAKKPLWLTTDATFTVRTPTRLTCSFLKEGAGYRNAFGYYFFPTASPPATAAHVSDVYFVFPNASAANSGGNLKAGSSILLPYRLTLAAEGGISVARPQGTADDYTFPAGTSVGFVLYPNAWIGSGVNQWMDGFYTQASLNPEKSIVLQPHFVNLRLPDSVASLDHAGNPHAGSYILCAEDINRGSGWGDNDFNDVCVLVASSQPDAVSGYVDTELIDPAVNTKLPQNGFNTGYKKLFAQAPDNSGLVEVVATLLIPYGETIRTSAFGKKRTTRAYVFNLVGVAPRTGRADLSPGSWAGHHFTSATSFYDSSFIYTKDSYVEAPVTEDPDALCGTGIHYFASQNAAEKYAFEY